MKKLWGVCFIFVFSACSVNETITTRKQTGTSQNQPDPALNSGPTQNYSSGPTFSGSTPSGTPTGSSSGSPTGTPGNTPTSTSSGNPTGTPTATSSGSTSSGDPGSQPTGTPGNNSTSGPTVAVSSRAISSVNSVGSTLTVTGISSSINNGVNSTSCTTANGACPTPDNCDMNDQCQLVIRGENLTGASAALLYAGNSYPLICPDPTSNLTSNANLLTCKPPTSGGIFSNNGPFDLQVSSPNGTVTITNVLRNGYYGH